MKMILYINTIALPLPILPSFFLSLLWKKKRKEKNPDKEERTQLAQSQESRVG